MTTEKADTRIDLSEYSLRDLLNDKSADLAEDVRRVTQEVQRPRFNLGGSSPPGRAD
jgi:hypothetical protein